MGFKKISLMDSIFVEMSKAGNFNSGISFTMSRSPEALRACCDDKQAGKRAGSSSMDSIFVQMGSGRRYFHGLFPWPYQVYIKLSKIGI